MRGGTSRDGGGAEGRDDPERDLCAALIRAVGRDGYENITVPGLLEEAGAPRASFYEHFGSLDECFRAAYQGQTRLLYEEMLQAGGSGVNWAQGFCDALRVLLEFVAEQPVVARALLVASVSPGSPVAEIHDSVLQRLARALDSARRQPGSRHSAPPLTADLMVGAITNTLHGLLVKGESARAPSLLGDYTYLVILAYFDEEAAFEAMDRVEDEA